MSNDYIKREDAITGLKALWDKIHEEDCLIDPDCKYGIDESIKAINNLSCADAVEVRHGHWLYTDDDDNWIYDTYRCSECRQQITVDAKRRCDIGLVIEDMEYCPYCGARMDGERKDGDNGA